MSDLDMMQEVLGKVSTIVARQKLVAPLAHHPDIDHVVTVLRDISETLLRQRHVAAIMNELEQRAEKAEEELTKYKAWVAMRNRENANRARNKRAA